jgi:hypothetical protein
MYRVYCFDGASRIVSADWIEAVNDAEALQIAVSRFDCPRVEVWHRDRFAGRSVRGDA